MPAGIYKSKIEFHGLTVGYKKHPLYKLREMIIYRCHGIKNTNHTNYITYKLRGIKVCEEWLLSAKVFYEWAIASGWKEGLTIDRIDSNGNYEPFNCRFITRSENSKKARLENNQNGANGPHAKLTSEIVLKIRELYKSGISQRKVASLFKIAQSTVGYINKRKTWKCI